MLGIAWGPVVLSGLVMGAVVGLWVIGARALLSPTLGWVLLAVILGLVYSELAAWSCSSGPAAWSSSSSPGMALISMLVQVLGVYAQLVPCGSVGLVLVYFGGLLGKLALCVLGLD